MKYKEQQKSILQGYRLSNKAISINIIFCSLKSEGRNENKFKLKQLGNWKLFLLWKYKLFTSILSFCTPEGAMKISLLSKTKNNVKNCLQIRTFNMEMSWSLFLANLMLWISFKVR